MHRPMKQRIIIPDKVSNSIFQLPVVKGYFKGDGGCAEVYLTNCWACPGDILEEDDEGKWWVIFKETNKRKRL